MKTTQLRKADIMDKNISDEKFETLLRSLIADASMNHEEFDAIAASPNVWHGVRRQIADQKQHPHFAWPPIAKFWQVLKFGVPALAAGALLLIGIFVLRPAQDLPEKAALTPDAPTSVTQVPSRPIVATPTAAALPEKSAFKSREIRHFASVRATTAATTSAKQHFVTTDPAPSKTEIKSDFIALSYAPDAESGQIVRVKVPSSMMVTLGLAAAVEKPTALIDAEVIVGDDGLTRAIRFIR
jgi:hypothetical protein